MLSLNKYVLLGVALASIGATTPAGAFCYIGGDEVYAALGVDVDDGNNQKDNGNAQQSGKDQSGVSNGRLIVSREERDFSNAVPADLKVLGLWVGNLSYKVGQSQNRLYIIDPRGAVSAMAAGTNADDVCVPEDNAFVKNIMRMQPVPSQESQMRANENKNGGSGRYIGGGAGLLVPTVVATRTMVVDGKPMIVGGPVVCELRRPAPPEALAPAPQAMPRPVEKGQGRQMHTQARIFRSKSHKQRQPAKKVPLKQ